MSEITAKSYDNEIDQSPKNTTLETNLKKSEIIWSHDDKEIKHVIIDIFGEQDYSKPLVHTFNITVALETELASLGDIQTTTFTINPNYISYPPHDMEFESSKLTDKDENITLAGSVLALDANLDDFKFSYCLLKSANGMFMITENINDDDEFDRRRLIESVITKEDLSICVDNVESIQIYTNPDLTLKAGNYDISIQACDQRRECISRDFIIPVDLTIAATPMDLKSSTCGKRVMLNWNLSRSLSFVSKYVVNVIPTGFENSSTCEARSITSKESNSIAPGLFVDFLEEDCTYFNLTVIACNSIGCSAESKPIALELTSESCRHIDATYDSHYFIEGQTKQNWQPLAGIIESPILVPDEDIWTIRLELPLEPLSYENVTVTCSSESDMVLLTPESVTFSANMVGPVQIDVEVFDDNLHHNGPWTFEMITCKTISEVPSDMELGLYAGGVSDIEFEIRNHNIIQPKMSQVFVEHDGNWLPTIANGKFNLPLSGATNVSIVCDEENSPHFFPNTELTVDGILVNVTFIHNGGHMINFTTPSMASVCGLEEEWKNCGYRGFSILNPPESQDGSLVKDISCPSKCPAESQGFFYTETCARYRSGASCLLEEFASECAFGSGDSCKSCPSGAICPGGYRIWPLPSYWTSTEDSGEVIKCQPPSSERCPGWNATSGNSECGVGYKLGSYGCMSCDSGFYEDTVKECEVCPPSQRTSDKIMPFVYVLLGFIALFVGTLAVVWIAVRRNGGKFSEGVKRTRDFAIFAVGLLQVFISVGQFAQSGLPSTVATLYKWLSTLNLNMPLMHPSCLSSDPFASSISRLMISIFVMLFVIFLTILAKFGGKKIAKKIGILRRWAVLWLALLYPVMVTESLKMTLWQSALGSIRLRSNLSYEYMGSDHLQAGIMGWIVLLTHCIGWPVVSWLYLRSLIKRENFDHKQFRQWDFFIGGTYETNFFWFRHMTFGFLSVTSFVNVYFNEQTYFDQFFKICLEIGALAVFIVLMFRFRPYREVKKWMFPTKVFSLMLCVLASILNVACFGLDLSDSFQPIVTITAWLLLCGSILLYVMLFYFFWVYVSENVVDNTGPRKSQKLIQSPFSLQNNGVLAFNPLHQFSTPNKQPSPKQGIPIGIPLSPTSSLVPGNDNGYAHKKDMLDCMASVDMDRVNSNPLHSHLNQSQVNKNVLSRRNDLFKNMMNSRRNVAMRPVPVKRPLSIRSGNSTRFNIIDYSNNSSSTHDNDNNGLNDSNKNDIHLSEETRGPENSYNAEK
eukprot:TRINITY_DN1493_c2_g3_i1.p1 TRINITY_DN1493_c2_g3~~TRINITY_DN1493_c2_g3_i1.p1  ORF type:complete len:1259 (+),score=299.24 TRINITY_DN1493_c2_g3_i1:88-3864(+)